MKAGPHFVGVAFLKKSSAPSVELLQPFLRERIDPHHARRHSRSSTRSRSKGRSTSPGTGNSPSRRRIFSCRPARRRADEAACAQDDADDAGAPRVPAAGRPTAEVDRADRLLRHASARRAATFEAGIENALAFMLVAPQFLFRFERDPDAGRRPTASTASAISSSRRGCRSSSGAASPTMSC